MKTIITILLLCLVAAPASAYKLIILGSQPKVLTGEGSTGVKTRGGVRTSTKEDRIDKDPVIINGVEATEITTAEFMETLAGEAATRRVVTRMSSTAENKSAADAAAPTQSTIAEAAETASPVAAVAAAPAAAHSVARHTQPSQGYVAGAFLAPTVEFNGDYANTFNDVQDVQIIAAESNGIAPLEDSTDIDLLVSVGDLEPVYSSEVYNCTAEYPFLVPKAFDTMVEIGRRYKQYSPSTRQLKLTGCLRTNDSVDRLMRTNGNAIKNSCHLYGTTFDISYSRMSRAEKAALARALQELRDAGYIYVKYEQRQPCFHITVR